MTAADVLTLHQRHTSSACLCGWSRLGHSFTQHQADMLAAAGLLVTPEHDTQVAARAVAEVVARLRRIAADEAGPLRSEQWRYVADAVEEADRIERQEEGR